MPIPHERAFQMPTALPSRTAASYDSNLSLANRFCGEKASITVEAAFCAFEKLDNCVLDPVAQATVLVEK
jgi:hypothetical protein